MEAYNTGKQRIFECSNCGYGIVDIYISDEEKYSVEPKYCPNCGAKIMEDERIEIKKTLSEVGEGQ